MHKVEYFLSAVLASLIFRIPLTQKKNYGFKSGFQSHVVIMLIEASCIKFSNNKLNSLKIYGIVQNYRILHKVLQRFSQHNLTKFATPLMKQNETD
jgi:hypothetical protein